MAAPRLLLLLLLPLVLLAWGGGDRALAIDPIELSTCSDDLRDLAEYIRYNVNGCPVRRQLFTIDGVPLADTLEYLAARLQEKKNVCPCIGPCEEVNCAASEWSEE